MAEATGLKHIVERVVSQVLGSHVAQLQEELVRRVFDEVQGREGASSGAAGSGATSVDLLKAVSSIHSGTAQREILRMLLDNMVRYSGRSALFIVKSGTATGWQGRGFSHKDDIKDFVLNVGTGMPERVMQSHLPFVGSTAEMDSGFVARFGAAADDRVALLPLVLKEKVAAIIYADAGVEPGGHLDDAALELLVLTTAAWLEVAALRRPQHREAGAEVAHAERADTAPAAYASHTFSDPFAAHAPQHAAAAAAGVEHSSVATAGEHSDTASSGAPAVDPYAELPQEEAEIHRKAHRFARLLVDEIRLYNQVKVAEGRKHADLYDRLREDIEKSRATYDKRYGSTVAASANYFNQELIHCLAEGDSSLMGASFRAQ
jgi:hypothetical protein